MAEYRIPQKGGGGPLLSDASEKDILYWLGRKRSELGESQYPARDQEWIAAAEAELKTRGVDPGQSAAATPRPATSRTAPSTRAASSGQARPPAAIQRAEPSNLVTGSYGNPNAAQMALDEAAKHYHLVTPATQVGSLPEGCEVVVSMVKIDPYGPEVYNITGNRKTPRDDDTVGIDRVALAKIGAAAGVTWLVSRRTDDGSHPHYCAWEVVGRFPNFDMSFSDVRANVEIDTRENGEVRGAAAEEIRKKARESAYTKDGGDSQLLELRKFLARHAESKAMNRAIAGRGVRRSYKREDLKKPFAVARLIFTGKSDDPEARKEFRQMIGQRFLGASQQLFAPVQQVQPMMLAQGMAQPMLGAGYSSPPPLTASVVVEQAEDDYRDDEHYSAPEPDSARHATSSTAQPTQQELKT